MNTAKEDTVCKPDAKNDEGLAQYFHEDFSVPTGVHPFMSEIAHLAHKRGISQGTLAKRYNEAAGTEQNKSRNVKRHMRSMRLSTKVIEAYAKIFHLSDRYVGLLMALRSHQPFLKPRNRTPGNSKLDVRNFVRSWLEIDLVEPLFEAGALEAAIDLAVTDESFAIECVNECLLTLLRHEWFDVRLPSLKGGPRFFWSPEVGTETYDWAEEIRFTNSVYNSIRMNNNCIVVLVTFARMLQKRFGVDLLGKKLNRSRGSLLKDAMLLNVFQLVSHALDEDEWLAVQYQLESILRRKGLPVEEMRKRLSADSQAANPDYWARKKTVRVS